MHYVVNVSVFECGTDLAGELNYLLKILRRHLAQVRTIHQFHNKERKAVVFTHVIDSHDVRMIQRRGRPRFAHETRARVVGGSSLRRTTAFGSSAIYRRSPFTRSPFPFTPFTRFPFTLS